MSDDPPNPYESPKVTRSFLVETGRPRIGIKDLIFLIVFASAGWQAMWPGSILHGPVPSLIFFFAVIRGVFSKSPTAKFTPRELAWLVLWVFGGMMLVFWIQDLNVPPQIAKWQQDPMPYLVGGIVSCVAILCIWWKRRNNPRCVGESTHANSV